MTYTTLILALLGLFGILLHNLIKLNQINRKLKGEINLGNYLKMERFTIIISICVIIIALIAQQEIKQLELVGKWLGLAYVAIGYTAQSLVIAMAGKTEKIIESETE